LIVIGRSNTRGICDIYGMGVEMSGATFKESFKVAGGQLVDAVKKLLHEGNVRRISIRHADGRMVAEFPLTVGVVGAVLAPVVAAVGALAAVLTECTIEVEREAPSNEVDKKGAA
jgi:hypothetical protein